MPLTSAHSLGEWLDHPRGGALIREMLTAAGISESMLSPIRGLSLDRLVTLSGGRLTPEMIEGFVAKANQGLQAGGEERPADWQERIIPGRFDGLTVIVTGAGSGIGRATASRIAREGGRVIAVDIAADRLESFAVEHAHAEVTTVQADVSRQVDVDSVIAAVGSRIDGLANVAGIADDVSPVHEVKDEIWDRVFAVNVQGLMRFMRAVLPSMLEAGRGSIVNVASEAALRGNASGAAYTASKHAVVGLTRSAAFMYGPSGIRVNAVAPGGVATGMPGQGRSSSFGSARLGPFLPLLPQVAIAEQVAASITFLLSDDATNINGVLLPTDAGWSVQ